MSQEDEVRTKFSNSSREKAKRAFFGDLWPDAKFDSLDEHTDFIKMLVDNPEIERLLGEAVFDALYREARKPADHEG